MTAYGIGSFLNGRKSELELRLMGESGSAMSTCQGLSDLRWIRDEGEFHRDDENKGWVNDDEERGRSIQESSERVLHESRFHRKGREGTRDQIHMGRSSRGQTNRSKWDGHRCETRVKKGIRGRGEVGLNLLMSTSRRHRVRSRRLALHAQNSPVSCFPVFRSRETKGTIHRLRV